MGEIAENNVRETKSNETVPIFGEVDALRDHLAVGFGQLFERKCLLTIRFKNNSSKGRIQTF